MKKLKFKFIPHFLTRMQFVISIEEHRNSEKYMILFEIDPSGFHNVYGVIPPEYGIELNSHNTDMIIDGVDIL
jgi:hypothetical protein